jgi:hypothetical protein
MRRGARGTEQGKADSAAHGGLDHLEAVDLAFGRASGPGNSALRYRTAWRRECGEQAACNGRHLYRPRADFNEKPDWLGVEF